MKARWILHSKTETSEFHSSSVDDQWPIDLSRLVDDAEEIETHDWRWPLSAPMPYPVESWAPNHLHPQIRDLIDKSLKSYGSLDQTGARLSTIRTSLRGTFIYEVDFAYKDNIERVYVAGLNNQFFTKRDIARRPGWFGKLKRFTRRTLQSMFDDDGPTVKDDYLQAVRAGTVHISDHKCLIRSVVGKLNAISSITEAGYTLAIPSQDGSVTELSIVLDHGTGGQQLISISCELGNASRQLFARTLGLNHSLTFGRIAVTPAERGGESFSLIDRRLYEFMSADRLAAVITGLVTDTKKIRNTKIDRPL